MRRYGRSAWQRYWIIGLISVSMGITNPVRAEWDICAPIRKLLCHLPFIGRCDKCDGAVCSAESSFSTEISYPEELVFTVGPNGEMSEVSEYIVTPHDEGNGEEYVISESPGEPYVSSDDSTVEYLLPDGSNKDEVNKLKEQMGAANQELERLRNQDTVIQEMVDGLKSPTLDQPIDNAELSDQIDALRRHNDILQNQLNDLAGDQIPIVPKSDDQLHDRVQQVEDDLERIRKRNDMFDSQRAMRVPVEDENPLPPTTTKRLNVLQDRYPNQFQFDPSEARARFSADLLFDSGKATIRTDAMKVLSEFAEIFGDSEVTGVAIFIEGHADNQRISRAETRSKHPTNWHLSYHRAMAVKGVLHKSGMVNNKMFVAGFGEHRPRSSNATEAGRQLNRRVEIFVRTQQPVDTANSAQSMKRMKSEEWTAHTRKPAASGARQSSFRVPTVVQAWKASSIRRR